jgi:ribosomal protein S20
MIIKSIRLKRLRLANRIYKTKLLNARKLCMRNKLNNTKENFADLQKLCAKPMPACKKNRASRIVSRMAKYINNLSK